VVSAVVGSLGYFARALARELGPTRVNVVSRGWVETEMWDAIAGESKTALWAEMAKRLPAGRIAKPADIARAYVFLLESKLTTGVTLRVDGGTLARMSGKVMRVIRLGQTIAAPPHRVYRCLSWAHPGSRERPGKGCSARVCHRSAGPGAKKHVRDRRTAPSRAFKANSWRSRPR
jgi:hypothetical protein